MRVVHLLPHSSPTPSAHMELHLVWGVLRASFLEPKRQCASASMCNVNRCPMKSHRVAYHGEAARSQPQECIDVLTTLCTALAIDNLSYISYSRMVRVAVKGGKWRVGCMGESATMQRSAMDKVDEEAWGRSRRTRWRRRMDDCRSGARVGHSERAEPVNEAEGLGRHAGVAVEHKNTFWVQDANRSELQDMPRTIGVDEARRIIVHITSGV